MAILLLYFWSVGLLFSNPSQLTYRKFRSDVEIDQLHQIFLKKNQLEHQVKSTPFSTQYTTVAKWFENYQKKVNYKWFYLFDSEYSELMLKYFEFFKEVKIKYHFPLDLVKINQGFNLNKTNGKKVHFAYDFEGRDLLTAQPLPIYSNAWGMVIMARKDHHYGNVVMVAHPDGNVSLYAHLDKIDQQLLFSLNSPTPKPIVVEPHTQIGIAGDTGYSFGIHLHFELRKLLKYDKDPKLGFSKTKIVSRVLKNNKYYIEEINDPKLVLDGEKEFPNCDLFNDQCKTQP